MCVES